MSKPKFTRSFKSLEELANDTVSASLTVDPILSVPIWRRQTRDGREYISLEVCGIQEDTGKPSPIARLLNPDGGDVNDLIAAQRIVESETSWPTNCPLDQ